VQAATRERSASAAPEPALREEKPCLLCGGSDTESAYEFAADFYDHARFETASWDGRQRLPSAIVRCKHCDLLYASPSFRSESLGHVYPKDLVESTLTFDAARAQTRHKHEKLLGQLRRSLAGGSVCDVGTRYGVLPHLACAAGYDAFGIEYNRASVQVAQSAGVPVFEGSVQDIPRVLSETGRAHVDAFVLDDVLEHLVDPAEALRVLRSCQRPGGRLFLQQMDLDSLGHRVFRRHWYYLQPAAHMYYFSEATLSALLHKVGYAVERVVRPALLSNVRRTLSRTLPGAGLKLVRSALPGHTPRRKPSYLTRRLRSADDMFLVVARRL
jgi:2-polyprenyl-3-methyl-5-hydroxy-6-metoxy-1,4-benzoquinol methylase